MSAFLKKYEGLWLFLHSPAAIIAAAVAAFIVFGAVFASWIALVNPYDLASFSFLTACCRQFGKTAQTQNTCWARMIKAVI